MAEMGLMQTSPDVTKLLTTETVLQFLLVVIIVGFGGWFARAGWPWLTNYLEKRQELQHSLEERRIACEAESDRRWQETTASLARSFADLKEELGAFRAMQRTTIESLERLFHYVVKNGSANGGNPGGGG